MTKQKEWTDSAYPGALGKLDRDGQIAWQYGRGGNAYYLPGKPGDPGFVERYQQLAGDRANQTVEHTYLRRSALADPVNYPPRGMSRFEAARYVGVGPSVFDELVAQRKMPPHKLLNGQRVWDRVQLDIAFTAFDSAEDESLIQKRLRESRTTKA